MKHFLSIITIFSFSILSAQISENVNRAGAGTNAQMLQISDGGNSFGSTMAFVNPKRRTVGSVHLFDNWNNSGIIITTDNQRFVVRNINLNVERNVFEAKTEDGESIFTFNFNNIDRFVINNKVYKNFYYDDDNRVYELIYESDDFILMKGHKVEMIEGSANPMVNRKFDKWVKKYSYYVKQGDEIKPLKLKKKKILKLVGGDEERAAMIEEYVEKNRLSYKNENDLKQVLEFTAKN